MQHSIFEPLSYCLQAHNMENCLQALKPAPFMHAPSLFTISPPSPQEISCSLHAHIITPPSSNYKKARSDQDLTSDSTHSKLPLSHTITLLTTSGPATACSNTSDADDRKCDDGSVASKLLSSITKSISSPSLQLSSCKEAARETPYQKTLKLKQMKLQHCAEALGMESSDNSSFLHDSQCIHQVKIDKIGSPSSCPPSFTLLNSHQESSPKSVKSSPNLSNNHSRYTRSTSFPPPLSHTLPTSSSYDSLSPSLRAYREDGRFILKETMVPSKHYFHAYRRNGRLTLHVLTREEEGKEHFASQNDHDQFIRRESERENPSEVEEEGIAMCVVSLYGETPGKSFDNKMEDSIKAIQLLNEEVCVKKSLGKQYTSKDNNAEASHLDVSLQRLNRIGNDNRSNNDISEEDDMRNVISNVITLSLQNSSHSKVTLHKAQVLSFPHPSIYPLISGSLEQSAFIHSTERNHGFLSSNHDMSTFTESKENYIWESNLLATSGNARIQREGGSGSGGGGGGGGAAAPAFVIEEMRAKSLMKVVSELATSLIVEGSYSSGNWRLAGEKKPLLSALESGESSTIIGGYARDIGSAIKNNQLIDDERLIAQCGANFGYNTSYFNEEEKACYNSEGGIKELNITTSHFNLNSQFSSPNANLQSEEWLHTLHCKELFDRHQLGQGLMKLHCISTRS